MSVLETKQIDKALKKKGFVIEERDHHFYFYKNDGKKTSINTKTSHSASEIGNSLIKIMAKQLHLEKSEFERLIKCTLSGEEYKEILKEKGLI